MNYIPDTSGRAFTGSNWGQPEKKNELCIHCKIQELLKNSSRKNSTKN